MRQRRATQSGSRATSSRLAQAVLIFWFSSRQRLLLYVCTAPPFGGVQFYTFERIEGDPLDEVGMMSVVPIRLYISPQFAVVQRATFLENN